MSAKSNSGEINESYASACQTRETSKLFATLNEEKEVAVTSTSKTTG